MTDFLQWMDKVFFIALGGLGALSLGLLRARVDEKKIQSDDRSEFTAQVLSRIAHVETQMEVEREQCEAKMAALAVAHDGDLERRDGVIGQLRDRIAHLESLQCSGVGP